MMRSIALMGRAGAGKDTAAAELVKRDGYVRVAFADPLKEMALAVDPVITNEFVENAEIADAWGNIRLSAIVNRDGWDVAKRNYPEVRRFLQALGKEGVRDIIGPNTWIDLATRKIAEAHRAGRPVVVTDVRFGNELVTLKLRGFVAVWIDRPGVTDGQHASEAELTRRDADVAVVNDATPAHLYEQLTWIRDGIA